MSRVETPKQPSVEELLVSIRQAIHGDGKTPLPKNGARFTSGNSNGRPKSPAVSASMSQTRVTLQAGSGKKSGYTRQHTDNFFKLRNQLQELDAQAPLSARPGGAANGSANGFAGIMSGDVRLEEALEKLKRAGLGDDQYQPDVAIRPSQTDHEEAEYTIQGSDDHLQDQDDFDQFEEVEEPAEFSPEIRQAYIEPPYTPPQQSDLPAIQSLAPLENPVNMAPPEPEAASVPLTSQTITAETSAAFNRLADTIVGHATTGERSIDDITRELLRPMLQSWMDENLPRLVERLVREEIERVARWGGR